MIMTDSIWRLDEVRARQVADEFLTSEGFTYRRFFGVRKHDDFSTSVFGRGVNPCLLATQVWEFGVSYENPDLVEYPNMSAGTSVLVFVDDLTEKCGIFYRM